LLALISNEWRNWLVKVAAQSANAVNFDPNLSLQAFALSAFCSTARFK
jgi:hypothetical protein